MPDPTTFPSVGWVLIAIAAICMAANQIDDFFKRRAGKDGDRVVGPQPFEVKAATEYVHKHEFIEHKKTNTQTHAELFASLRASEAKLAETAKRDLGALQEKISEVAEQNAAQEAKQDLMNQRQASMDSKIDRIMERFAIPQPPKSNRA